MLARAFSLFAFIAMIPVLAQPTPPGGGGGITAVPIDGGLAMLAIAGGALAIRKLRA